MSDNTWTCRCCGSRVGGFVIRLRYMHPVLIWHASWSDILCLVCIKQLREKIHKLGAVTTS